MNIDELKGTLNEIILLHESMKYRYFFKSPYHAWERRNYEREKSLISKFEYNGKKYEVHQNTECTCAHVYYSIKYYENDIWINKDIRFIKKILAEINQQTAA